MRSSERKPNKFDKRAIWFIVMKSFPKAFLLCAGLFSTVLHKLNIHLVQMFPICLSSKTFQIYCKFKFCQPKENYLPCYTYFLPTLSKPTTFLNSLLIVIMKGSCLIGWLL